jgi:hypothetical protein
MKLIDALESRFRIRLSCKTCGAHQPAYTILMVDKHGPDMEFEEAVKLEQCIFCKTAGDFTVFIYKSVS